jgi:hypothetical protein
MRSMFFAFALSCCATVAATGTTQPEQFYGHSSVGETGPSRNGFALSLRPDKMAYALSGPIWVTVEIRNESGRDRGGIIGSRHSGYSFLIKNKLNGSVVSENPNNDFGGGYGSRPSTGWSIPKGTSMYARFRLDLMYSFKVPGVYSVMVIRGQPTIDDRRLTLQSNAITITVLP